MATCKDCGALLPMDYFLLDKCRYCIDTQTEVDYTDDCMDTTDMTSFSFLEDYDD